MPTGFPPLWNIQPRGDLGSDIVITVAEGWKLCTRIHVIARHAEAAVEQPHLLRRYFLSM